MKDFPVPPEIKKSLNYDSFHLLEWNRDINKANLSKLVEENKQKFQLHKFPILVDNAFKIIDGQHRFAACKELGAPVYYIQEATRSKFSDVTSVNRAGRTHKLKDMLTMGARAGDAGCKAVVELHSELGGEFDLGAIAHVCAGYAGGGVLTDILKRGKGLDASEFTFGRDVLLALKKSFLEDRTNKRTILSVATICRNAGIPAAQLVARLDKNRHRITKTATHDQCVEVLVAAYNYNLSRANQIFFKKWGE